MSYELKVITMVRRDTVFYKNAVLISPKHYYQKICDRYIAYILAFIMYAYVESSIIVQPYWATFHSPSVMVSSFISQMATAGFIESKKNTESSYESSHPVSSGFSSWISSSFPAENSKHQVLLF